MDFPMDYVERVYAGILGKIIGVYLGRPIEGWTYGHILEHGFLSTVGGCATSISNSLPA
jgi:hypothetical protein